jgi:hypothetical protein
MWPRRSPSRGAREGIQTAYADPDAYPLDGRGAAYHFAFFSAKHFGAGQFYLFSIKDAQGQRLQGAKDYRLTVPANVPVNLYWSATIYDRETHTLIRDLPWSSRSSHSPGLQEIAFGPQPPPDRPQNWIPTDPGGAFEVIFRFYGPEKALFDKSWQLPDIQSAAFIQIE